jgi:hypothetical protein
MTFLNPALLWGALAIAIPIAVHLWQRQRGSLLDWAATRWLPAPTQQPQRGWLPEKLWLLLLRCAIVLTVTGLLSRPLLLPGAEAPTKRPVHLLQADAGVVDAFRFELENALGRKEPVFWVKPTTKPVTVLTQPTDSQDFNGPLLQTTVNQLAQTGNDWHIYARNDRQTLAAGLPIRLPGPFALHLTADPRPPATRLLPKKPVRVWLNYRDPAERQFVGAALLALNQVFGTDFRVEPKRDAARWLLTDEVPAQVPPNTRVLVSGPARADASGTTYAGESLVPSASARVAGGQLPEWLGEQLLGASGVDNQAGPLSDAELKTMFVADPVRPIREPDRLNPVLLLLLIGCIGLERWLAVAQRA